MEFAEQILRGALTVSLAPGTNAAGGVVAIRDERIVAVGGDEVIDRLRGPATTVHEFPGAAILPGLVDAHAHPVWGSLQLGSGISLDGAASLDDVRDRLAAVIASHPAGSWITGGGLDLGAFGGSPDGRIFQDWFPNVPISLMTRDAHALVVSPRVIELAGLTGQENLQDASRIVVDAAGHPTGWVVELQAMDLVLDRYPEESWELQAEYLREGLRTLAAGGLTGVHALDFHDPSERLLRLLDERDELPLRVRASPLVPADSDRSAWESIAALQGLGGRRWRVEGVKFMLDGTADNGTAWFEEPDVRGENHRALWRDPDAFRDAVRFFTERDVPTVTHAIGDRAVRFVLDVVAEVGHAASAPHRIEHIESIPDELLGRFAELGVVAGLQPTHATRLTDPNGTDNWSLRIGSVRASRGWRTRDLLRHGAVVTLSSDWPIGVGDPRVSLAESQLRRPVGRPEARPVQPEQALSAREAYAGMTLAPAVASGTAHELGRVAPGYLADLTVLAANPLALTPEEQVSNPVLATFVGGELIVHNVRTEFST